jgi:hypothetical protein
MIFARTSDRGATSLALGRISIIWCSIYLGSGWVSRRSFRPRMGELMRDGPAADLSKREVQELFSL